MKIGIFGSEHDAQCKALSSILQMKGAEVVIVESQGLNLGVEVAFDGENFSYAQQRFNDVKCWYLRYIMSPLPPAFEMSDKYYLFADWFIDYMHRREKFGFQLSWLLSLSYSGIPIINPPEHGSVIQLKPFQLQTAKSVGLKIPKTLITNSKECVIKFAQDVGSVVFKPTMGGGLCKILDKDSIAEIDSIVASPVIFQERIEGKSIRLTFIGNELVSSVAISSNEVDYRSDPVYSTGQQDYESIIIPDHIIESCRLLMRNCGLLFSGIDFILKSDGTFVFLESNSSPIYLDIERKTKVPITAKLADYMLRLANEPQWYREELKQASRSRSFIAYALPFNPKRTILDA